MASPPQLMTAAFLAKLERQPGLPPDTWYLIAATTLAMLNRPEEIGHVYRHAIGCGPDGTTAEDVRPGTEEGQQLRTSRRLREALIKASAIGGLPKTINALASLKEVTPPSLLDRPGGPSPTGRWADAHDTHQQERILDRGRRFFDAVYGKVAARVMGQLDGTGTGGGGNEDLGVAARLVYGHVLSNTRVLGLAETEFVMIAGLVPQDVNPQLKGHLRGALNGGATLDEVRAVRAVAVAICEACGMRRLGEGDVGGWGWRSEVANV